MRRAVPIPADEDHATLIVILYSSRGGLNKISGAVLRAIRERFVLSSRLFGDNHSDTPVPVPLVRNSRYGWHLAGLCSLGDGRSRLLTAADCLTKNGYNEAKCTKLVDALYECCQAFYEKNGDEAATVSCPKPHLLRLKIEQRRKNSQ
jgi:hypothetical protein